LEALIQFAQQKPYSFRIINTKSRQPGLARAFPHKLVILSRAIQDFAGRALQARITTNHMTFN
jgi:hypothetical protein